VRVWGSGRDPRSAVLERPSSAANEAEAQKRSEQQSRRCGFGDGDVLPEAGNHATPVAAGANLAVASDGATGEAKEHLVILGGEGFVLSWGFSEVGDGVANDADEAGGTAFSGVFTQPCELLVSSSAAVVVANCLGEVGANRLGVPSGSRRLSRGVAATKSIEERTWQAWRRDLADGGSTALVAAARLHNELVELCGANIEWLRYQEGQRGAARAADQMFFARNALASASSGLSASAWLTKISSF
jgi:hypothetical protein